MTKQETVTKIDRVIDAYLAAWNEPDAAARSVAIAELWIEDGTYTDPLASVQGHEAIAALIAGAREQFPGYVFALSGDIDAHHDIARFTWELVPERGGEAVVAGFDAAVFASDGRIRNVYGFLDKVPAN